jgi:4-alpha-glucanotransferase
MDFQRSSGLLLHPTCLPGRFGIGELGPQAYELIDFIADSGMTLWQVLPLGPTGFADSPYQCLSAFAGNTLLIPPAQLVADEFLAAEEVEPVPAFPTDQVAFGDVIPYKRRLLELAYDRFHKTPNTEISVEFNAFREREKKWLDSYALFRVLKEANKGAPWFRWDKEYSLREETALRKICRAACSRN